MRIADRRLSRSLLLAVLFCGVSLRAEDGGGAEPVEDPARRYVKQLAARSKGLRSLHVRFQQEKRLRILRRPRISEGELWYSEGRLSMIVRRQGTVESHLVMKDGELRILYPELKRLETLEAGPEGGGGRRGTRMAIPFLSGDWEAAERDYAISLRREKAEAPSGERVVLELVPRDSGSPVKSVRMVLVDERLREYSQEERSGDTVRMQILSWEENREIPPERFLLQVPPGTETVRLR